MPRNRIEQKKKLLAALTTQIRKRSDSDALDPLLQFVEHYYRVSPVEELQERSSENLYGASLSCFSWLGEWRGERRKLRVFNPSIEAHGWHCSHTVIQLLHQDMPFIVDSVRMELNRRGKLIHVVHSAVLTVDPNTKAVLDSKSDQGVEVSLLYIEIDRTTDTQDIKEIHEGIEEVMSDLCVAVDDYQPMLDKARELASELTVRKDPESLEAAQLLEWMCQDHFTFLGFDQVNYKRSKEQIQVEREGGTELGIMRIYAPKGPKLLRRLSQDEAAFRTSKSPLFFAKDYHRSRVHRPAYQDMVVVKAFNKRGEVTGEYRFFGLYTSPVYVEAPWNIPVVRKRLERIVEQTGFGRGGYAYKTLQQTFIEMPRDELMLSTDDELFINVMGIFNLQERRKVRLLHRRDISGNFNAFLYYVPRDIFNTQLRSQVQRLLCERLGVEDSEFTSYYSESVLTRVYFVLPSREGIFNEFDPLQLEEEVAALSLSWDDELGSALLEFYGEERGSRLASVYRHAFPAAYREHFSASSAAADMEYLEQLRAGRPIALSFYRQIEQSRDLLRFKLFAPASALVLSDVIPILENLGMCVLGEHPYRVRLESGAIFWIHDFSLEYRIGEQVDMDAVKHLFQDAFENIWHQHAESDAFNRLVIGAHLSWREVAMLRAYARYNQQIRFGFSQQFIAATLARHLQITRLLVALFRAQFEPERQSSDKVKALTVRLINSIQEGLERVENLNDDKILRRYLELIRATVRTNFFRTDELGDLRSYFSFKIRPSGIEQMPLPRPAFEVFVYSPQVEGVHLRGGKVARGGLRWSDRLEDYRTEVLGLVKAQQVKNAVIVPVGAKGGFVAKTISEDADREEIQSKGVAAYQTFIRALLDITDNLDAGTLVPPDKVVRLDEDDPYLVVAADKGTATFSDIANQIAAEYGFWLGDAFASGGSQGYDHKKMGITARGAWESVKLHFREEGRDIQSEPFTVIGIGDMSGDVFGNGMLLSEQIRLQAGFNHLHIFIDPDPDPTSSYQERKRLFELPRSSWTDYDAKLISAGGGVFSRAAKSIDITPEMKQAFDIHADKLSPSELISALLCAPVDLLWNGGIGTYVKASTESHADVGDKANDSLRVDACQLRAKVVGEGGNLGLTQRARIEYSLNGGSCNTDFIDNAGGVDCSDHEVNIKIALQAVLQAGDLTEKQRNKLLADMTERVAQLVLTHNYRQALALSLAESQLPQQNDDYPVLIRQLEQSAKLNRVLEFLPDDEQLSERTKQGKVLSRPELSVLISYVKGELKERLNDPLISDDPYVAKILFEVFPEALVERFESAIADHRLRAEIIATHLGNALVNQMGIPFVMRVAQATGRSSVDIARAWVAARDIFDIPTMWGNLEALDNQVDAATLQSVMGDIQRLMRRVCVWLLRQYAELPSPEVLVKRFASPVAQLRSELQKHLTGMPEVQWQVRNQLLMEKGVPESLARDAASLESLFSLLDISLISEKDSQSLEVVCDTYFAIGDRLSLYWLEEQIKSLDAKTRWQVQAREVFREDLNRQQHLLALSALNLRPADSSCELPPLESWEQANQVLLSRWSKLTNELQSGEGVDSAILTVAMRELQAFGLHSD